MGKISNVFILFGTICILAVIVITRTTMEITEHHEEKLIYATNTKIQVKAKRCYLENKCSGVVTLEHLYKNKYLDEIINPVTKEVVNKDSTVEFVDGKIIINYK
ncbi:MAG: hypothetical protein J5982_03200 [Bacilli bacterium]|nr:hypothetical protein [Bacilli bacterium]